MGRSAFKMWLSLWHCAHLTSKCPRASRMEGGSVSKCGSRLSPVHSRLSLQQFHGFPKLT
eukprot:3508102-Pyramimonas_sp.AAC.1